jgi:hypothetical protein
VQTSVEFTQDTFHAALWSFIEGALLALLWCLCFLEIGVLLGLQLLVYRFQ